MKNTKTIAVQIRENLERKKADSHFKKLIV